VSADTGSTIDVMILYTATAANEAGGGTGMDTQVDLGITETNTAYANSGVTPRLRLVYKGQVDYVESGTNVDADLVSLQSGRIPNAAALREQYGADIVSLWVGGTYAGVCGVAYVMNNPSAGFADFAFNVVVRRCATGNFSLGHEIGHILGACHDWIQDGRCGSQFAYAHGHVAPNNAFRTIMSYASSCTDSAHPTGCPRIQYFSNPNVTYQGQPVGAAGGSMPADNRQVFNQTAAIVANFRQCTTLCNALSTPIVPTPTPPPTATPASTPTATPAPVCTPRPDVSVSAVPGPNGTLQVTVTANSSTGVPNIRITALQFGAATNALVDVAGRTGVTGNTTVTLPSPAAQVSFVVRRAAAGQATTVPLTVMDSCGGWPTLVGGGPGAF